MARSAALTSTIVAALSRDTNTHRDASSTTTSTRRYREEVVGRMMPEVSAWSLWANAVALVVVFVGRGILYVLAMSQASHLV